MIVDFKAELKKVNLKKKGMKEIVLEVSDNTLENKLDKISCMIGQIVHIEFENEIVTYNVDIDSISNTPINQYKVDEKGVVHVEKYEAEQLDADKELGITKNVEIVKEEHEIEKETIKLFIIAGLAPEVEGLPEKFSEVALKLCKGESVLEIASELGISTGKIPEMMDEYMEKIAPFAKAWQEWKEEKGDE